MTNLFLYGKWLSLDLPTRTKIAQQFGIAKTLPTHVQSDQVVQDGYKVQDIEGAISVAALQEYTGVESVDMEALWDLMVAKITSNGEIVTPEPVVVEPVVTEPVVTPDPTPVVEPEVAAPKKKVVAKKKVTKKK